MSNRLDLVMQLNPEFAEALAKGERWAVRHAEAIKGIDGLSSRQFPERDFEDDGTKKNWCGSCPFAEGCMVCDLPYDHGMKGMVGIYAEYEVVCDSCDFKFVCETTSAEHAVSEMCPFHRRHRQSSCTGCLTAKPIKDVFSSRRR